MPKNTKGGSKHKKSKNYVPKERKTDLIRKDTNPEELESYGKVIKAAGNRRFSVCCQKADNPNELITIMCKIKGSFRKRVKTDDYVLVKHFGFSEQAQIIDVYSNNELEMLKTNEMWDFPCDGAVSKHKNLDLLKSNDDSENSDSESDDPNDPDDPDDFDDPDNSDPEIDIDNI